MTDPEPPRCPYVGLQPYAEADIDYFFGRERDQRIIAANLGATALTVLYGASGVGKSSVLLAGVVPYLRARPRTAVVVVRDWRGATFLDALRSKCMDAVERVLQKPPSIDPGLPFDEFLAAAGQALQGSLLIIFDQFEEYFLYHPESETGQTFDVELARAVNRDDVDAAFLFALREDGLAKLDRFGGRIPNLLGNTLRLQHLTAADAVTAIRKPLDVFNERHPDAAPVTIEDALVDAIIDQVRSGQVMLGQSGGVGQTANSEETAQIETPFLQLVMTRLWEEEMKAGSRVLRLATLERLGGAEKIVRMHLDEVMEGLDGARQEVCAKFFDRLVTPSGTKIACSLRDLTVFAGPRSGEVAPILETLCASRILRGIAIPGANRPSETSYEIYNDVLAPAILDWRRGYLQAQERAEAEQRAAEQAQAKAKAAYASRLRILYGALIVFAFVAAGFLGLWLNQLRLQAQAYGHQAHARELAAAAQNLLEPDPELGTLLAIEAVRATYLPDGTVTTAAADVLRQFVRAPHSEKRLLGLGGAPRTMFFTPDGTRLVVTRSGPTPGMITGTIWDISSSSRAPAAADEKAVEALAFTPDGQRYATAGPEGAVRVLDAASGKEMFAVVHNNVVTAAVFSPDGQRLATASNDGTVKISDASSVRELITLAGPDNKIAMLALAFSPDAKWLAVASQDHTITVRDADNGAEAFKNPVPGQSIVTSLTFNTNGKGLATLSSAVEQNVTVWEVPSGKFSPPLSGQYNAVAFSPDGNILASGGKDRSVDLWYVRSAEHVRLRTLFGHADSVLDVVFSPDASRIATASADGTARIWDTDSGRELLSLRGAKAPDDKVAKEKASVEKEKASVEKVAFSPDGTLVATASHDGTVRLWDVGSTAEPKRVVFSADGRRLAISSADGTVKIWDADTRRALGTLGPDLGEIYGLVFIADGSRLVTANRGQATVWDLNDLKTHQPMVSFATDLTGSTDLAWSDGESLVTAGGRGGGLRAKVWDPNGHFLRAFGGSDPADAVAMSGDGHHLATTSPDGDRVEIWDEGVNHPSWSISGKGLDSGQDLTFWDVALSPSGQYVASVSTMGLMQLWDVRSRKLFPLPADYLARGSSYAQSGMAFSPDGTHLAAAYPKTVVVWDIANKGNPTFIRVGDVNTLAFSPDGKRLATASRDGTFQVWPLAAEDLIALAQALIAPRVLSQDECKVYHVEPCPKSN